jgi:hypothetical protein
MQWSTPLLLKRAIIWEGYPLTLNSLQKNRWQTAHIYRGSTHRLSYEKSDFLSVYPVTVLDDFIS